MRTSEVVVIGGGPTGLMLGAELTLAGIDVAIIERRPTPELVGSRAGGFHSRTIEILDQRGIADRFLAEGTIAQAAMLGSTPLDISHFPTRHPYSLGLWQNHIERILAGWIGELGVPVVRDAEVVGFTQDDAGVHLQLLDGSSVRAQYVVGADGGRSVIRRDAAVAFTGPDATRSNLIAEVELTEEPPHGIRQDATGIHGLHRMEDGRTFRVMVTEQQLGPSTEPTLADLRAELRLVFGTDFGAHRPTWISRFTDATRQAESYRAGRVLLAGDAAHIHYPAGGQGIGLGIQDAVNLGWKLAQVIRGRSAEVLLDTYHAERHPAGARALELSMAQSVLQRGDARNARAPPHGERPAHRPRGSRHHRGDDSRARPQVRAWRRPPLARTADARPRPRDLRRTSAHLRLAAAGTGGAHQLRSSRRRRPHRMGRSGPARRCGLQRAVGAPGAWRGGCAGRRPRPP